jgi:hypothetical protein
MTGVSSSTLGRAVSTFN